MQYGDEEQTCVVYQAEAEFPPQANCKSVIEPLIMTNSVHEEGAGSHKVGSHRRAYGGARSHTLEQLAEFGKVWSVYDRPMEQAVTWADVKSDIVVREVGAPATSASWETYEAALILTECDSGAQRSFFRTFEFDSCGRNQFRPPLMESHWHNLVGGFIEVILANDVREMGETVRQAKNGVGTSWQMLGHCLEQDSLLKGGRRRPPGPASAEWVENGADRKEVISVMNGLSKSILAKCMGTRDDEQYVDSFEVEEAKKPTGDTDDSSG